MVGTAGGGDKCFNGKGGGDEKQGFGRVGAIDSGVHPLFKLCAFSFWLREGGVPSPWEH